MFTKNLLKAYEALKPYGAVLRSDDYFVGYYFAAGKDYGFSYPTIIIDLTAPEAPSNAIIYNILDRLNKRNKKVFYVDHRYNYMVLADADIEAAYNAASQEAKTFLNAFWGYIHENRINHRHAVGSKEEVTAAEAAGLAAVDRLKKAREAA